jgi:chromate transporter
MRHRTFAAGAGQKLWTSAIHLKSDFALALAAFGLLVYGRVPPVVVVVLAAGAGFVLGRA